MGSNLSAENSQETLVFAVFLQETPITAAKFLKNAGNRRYFCTKYRWVRVFFADPLLSSKNSSQNFDPGSNKAVENYENEINCQTETEVQNFTSLINFVLLFKFIATKFFKGIIIQLAICMPSPCLFGVCLLSWDEQIKF